MKPILVILFLLFGGTAPSRPAAKQHKTREVKFTYFLGTQTFEDWVWISDTAPASEIEYQFARWKRDIELTAVAKWQFTGAEEVYYDDYYSYEN